jgi:hypothetical protein
MNNLYHKIAVASVCTALSFTLGANKEAKAVTITLSPTIQYGVVDYDSDREGDWSISAQKDIYSEEYYLRADKTQSSEIRALYEFNINTLSLTEDISVSRAIFQASILNTRADINLQIFGYLRFGGSQPDISNFNRGRFVAFEYRPWIEWRGGQRSLDFDVTEFFNDARQYTNYFPDSRTSLGFSIRTVGDDSGVSLSNPILEVTAVPEPTTIFGSAIGLCLGGWLKRRKSALQNKTTS